MNRDVIILFLVASLAWCVPIMIKASQCLKAGREYEFKLWDGGLMMNGKRTGKVGTVFMLVFAVVVVLLDIGLLGQL